MTLTIRPASREEAIWFSSRLRSEDRREIETASGQGPETILPLSFDLSDECYTIRIDPHGDPVAIYGMVPDTSHEQKEGIGVIWLLATPEVRRASLALLREVPHWLNAWALKYPNGIHNIVDSRNQLHVRWLKLMGFQITHEIELRGVTFYHFIY